MYMCKRCGRLFKNRENLSYHKRTCDKIPVWILELDDDGKLKQKYYNKKVNARKENLECNLTYEEFCTLLRDAEIKSSDLGFTSVKKYVLARYNDTGPYSVTNCRFVTQKENAAERHVSDKIRSQSSLNMKKYNSRVKHTVESEMYYQWLEKFLSSDYMQELKSRPVKAVLKDERYSGKHNSQFGTFWITNGSNNQKWKEDKGPLPSGYYKGRTAFRTD